jgi:uridine kinase
LSEEGLEILAKVDACLDRWRLRAGGAPFFIGIGGGSASGKTTLAQQMADLLAPFRVMVIHQDRFFKTNEEKPRYFSKIHGEERPDYNCPDSFRVEEMIAFCRDAKDADVVLLEGILTLHFTELRDLMDLKVFVHADADERIVRRIRRNLTRSSLDDIVGYYLESVRYRHREFCEPTRSLSDVVMEGGMAWDEDRISLVQEICGRIKGSFRSGP